MPEPVPPAVDESLPLAFLFVPVKAVTVTPVPLEQGPALAVEEKVMSAHFEGVGGNLD